MYPLRVTILACIMTISCVMFASVLMRLPIGEEIEQVADDPGLALPDKQKPNRLTRAEKKQGWTMLYDGETTKGWHVFHHRSDGSSWKSVDGNLYFDPSNKKDGKSVGGGDLVTDEVYGNFHFSIEWKIAKNGNSGLIFLVQEESKFFHTYYTGPEMQVLDNAGHPDAKIKTHRAGDLYDLISCSEETVKPAGEWNKAEIRHENGKLDLYLNGKNVVSTVIGDENWKQMIAKSKFKNMPGFGAFSSGRIALQDHGDEVWYRNIKIRKL